jgi:hypothetical protein
VQLLWDFPRSECSWGRLARLFIRSTFDVGVYCAACAVSHHDKLIALRGQAVSRDTIEEFMIAMQMIRAKTLETASSVETHNRFSN